MSSVTPVPTNFVTLANQEGRRICGCNTTVFFCMEFWYAPIVGLFEVGSLGSMPHTLYRFSLYNVSRVSLHLLIKKKIYRPRNLLGEKPRVPSLDDNLQLPNKQHNGAAQISKPVGEIYSPQSHLTLLRPLATPRTQLSLSPNSTNP